MHAPESTGVERDFGRGVADLLASCTYQSKDVFEEDRANVFKANSCHALAHLLIREYEVIKTNGAHRSAPAVKEAQQKTQIKSLLMQSCQWGNWEACTTYGVFALDGAYDVAKNVPFGIEILEKACLNGAEPKACINLERLYKESRGKRTIFMLPN